MATTKESFGTAAPTTGTWAVGDKVYNTDSAIGQPVFWSCITAGTPGTWLAVGVISPSRAVILETIADLRLLSPSVVHGAEVEGYYEANDGGGDSFHSHTEAAPGTYVDNGGTIIVPTGGDGSEAWMSNDAENTNIKKFGAKGDGSTDDTARINAALTAAGDHGETQFPKSTADYIVDGIGVNTVSMYGRARLKAKAGAANIAYLGREITNFWFCKVSGLFFDGNSKGSNGLSFKDIGGSTHTSSKAWILDNLKIVDCIKGIEKLYGNIGNDYNSLSVTLCDFGYWAQGVTSPVEMHAGCDTFNQGYWAGHDLAAFYINDIAGNGGKHVWNGCIIEGNPGFGIFVKNHLDQVAPISINNGWFENNATAGSVTIDSVVYTPRDMYFENVTLAEVNSTKFKTLELVNSSVVMDKCFFNSNNVVTIDADSSVRITNAMLDNYKPGTEVIIESVGDVNRGSGGEAAVFATVPRIKIASTTFSGVVAISDDGSTPVTFTGTGNILTTSQSDGLSYGTCQELVQPSAYTSLHPTVFSITSGKYYVTIAELKRAATDSQTISFEGATTLCSALQVPARVGEWSTIASISVASATGNIQFRVRNDDANPATLRYGALQLVEFDSYRDALAFFNARLLVE